MKRITQSRLTRRGWFGLLGFFCVLLFAACSLEKPSSEVAPNASNSAAAQVLKIAVDPNFPPFEMKAADGSLTGFDIDLINAIGSSAGFVIDFDEMNFNDLIRSLYASNIDAAVSAITINQDRAAKVSFSRPYFRSGLAIAVPEQNTDINSLETLRGKRIAVQQGTTSEAQALTVPDAKVQTKPSAPEALQALVDGQVDAVINDAPVTAYAINNGTVKGLKLVGALTEEYYGIATPKNSPNIEKINTGLTNIFNNGTYAQIYRKWFGAEPPQLPESI